MITRSEAAEFAAMEPDDFVSALRRRDLLTADGLHQVLQAARAALRDDPSVGARLAQSAIDASEAARAPEAVPRATYLLAQAAASAGEMSRALELIDEASSGFAALGLGLEALRTNLGRSQALNEMGNHAAALAACETIIDSVGSPRADQADLLELLAAAHQNSGLCLELTGAFESALDHYAAATVGYEALGDRRSVAEVGYDRGLALLHLGRHEEALVALDRARATFRDDGYRALEVMALANIADVLMLRGEYQRCLQALADARARLDDIEWPGGRHWPLLASGRASLALNLLPEARAELEHAVEVLDGTDLAVDAARARWAYAVTLARAEEVRGALPVLERAVEQLGRSGETSWLVQALVDLAELRLTVGAIDAGSTALDRAVSVATPRTPAWVIAMVARARLQGRLSADEWDAVLDAVGQLQLSPLVALVSHARGRALLDDGRHDEAVRVLWSAVDAIEGLRGGLSGEVALSRFLDDKQGPFVDLLDAMLRSSMPAADCLSVAERAKSRTLAELVDGLVTNDRLEVDDADLHAAYSELFALDPADARAAVLRQRLRELETRSPAATPSSDLPVRYTERRSSGHDEPVTATTVSYAMLRDEIRAFITIGAETQVSRPVSRDAVTAAVERLRRHHDRARLGAALGARHADQLLAGARHALAELHDLLWVPVAEVLPMNSRSDDEERIVVIPDGVLHEVPFHALWTGETWLASHHLLSVAPSRATLARIPMPRTGVTLAVGLADELAPQVEDEVKEIARITGTTPLVGDAARWDDVLARLDGVAHLHLAGHAMFRPDNPMFSALRLADRWVTAADVIGRRLDGATVVLSACDSGRTQHRGTPEINGFVRAFIGAGAATVVTSLWAADDAATAALMGEFYTALARGEDAAAALRHAQLTTAAHWPHPYHWAPWVVVTRA